MLKLDLSTAEALIDFRGGDAVPDGLARQQLEGTVALHNMLSEHGLAYLGDEVGMGKTYIALGVIALMRRFKPDLRVLYLLPKNNVRDKWRKDYRSFVASNYLQHDGIVKGFGQEPAAPYRNCQSLADLIQAVATDSVRDYFVCTSAFSLALGNSPEQLAQSLDEFGSRLPQYGDEVAQLKAELLRAATPAALAELKGRVKACWARALHAMLPHFDLVLVDESHNYRRGIETSDRNRLLSMVLGTAEAGASRIGRVLLLSATPFDRDVGELQRQLELFGQGDKLTIPPDPSWQDIHRALVPFTVRRLNALVLGDTRHTRNMYRTEHRTGEQAEIRLGLEQQLFAAVLQKKVSEAVNDCHHGKFELGMLASFESYCPNTFQQRDQFDGDEDERAGKGHNAADRGIVDALVHDFRDTFGRFPPHPKMDEVARRADHASRERNKKTLVFVRRVASVGELKAKLEERYNDWLAGYVKDDPEVHRHFGQYRELLKEHEHRQLADDQEQGKLATFFSWFYRGDNSLLKLEPAPHNLRQTLLRGTMFEIDWSTLPGMPAPDSLDWSLLSRVPVLPASPTAAQRFLRAQYAYLSCVAAGGSALQQRVARRVLDTAFEHGRTEAAASRADAFAAELGKHRMWTVLRETDSLRALTLPWDAATFDAISAGDEAARRLVRRHMVHASLFASVCRLDHPFIDLYGLRNSRGGTREMSVDEQMTAAFCAALARQAEGPGFSSFTILRDLTGQLDLILKQNFEDIDRKTPGELSTYIANQLDPLSPVVGATGENADSRSALARKFRMPGYPRVLVSTDVFQEGEDLHTFCDSVVHYGISASPIALEQKVGRVDRIGSLSHRAMAAAGDRFGEHFIQVGFPHIRQSLEFLQVRAAAHNLNQFHLSLQRVEGAQGAPDSRIDVHTGLLDDSGVEPPITIALESPFTIPASLLAAGHRPELYAGVRALEARRLHCLDLVHDTLRQLTDGRVEMHVAEGTTRWTLPNEVSVELRGAQGSGHLILCTGRPAAQELDREALASAPLDYLRALQADPALRLQLRDRDKATTGAELLANAEIYAGGAGILSAAEVRDLYARVAMRDSLCGGATPRAEVEGLMKALCGHHGAYRVARAAGDALDYHFTAEKRQQRVVWELHNGYVLVRTQVLDEGQLLALAAHPELLLAYTLKRNRRFDVVDFHIDAQCGLSVRALHPLGHLNREELAFICHLVASNAERLRQVLASSGDAPDPDDGGAAAPARDDGLRHLLLEQDALCCLRAQLVTGGMPEDELIAKLARELGWSRTSARRRDALNGLLTVASRRRIVSRRAGHVDLYAGSIGAYDTGFLKEQFLAALSAESTGFVERELAIRRFARWLGFGRTGPRIVDAASKLIRSLVRADRLLVQGSRIKRAVG